MTNQLLDAGFLDDQCLSGPLPEQWLLLPAAALTKRRCSWALTLAVVLCAVMVAQWWWDLPWLLPVLGSVSGLIFVASWFWLPLAIRHSRFLLRTEDFLLQSRVLWHKAVLIPLHRVQHVIERHLGRVFVESVYGQGSVFGFLLPAEFVPTSEGGSPDHRRHFIVRLIGHIKRL